MTTSMAIINDINMNKFEFIFVKFKFKSLYSLTSPIIRRKIEAKTIINMILDFVTPYLYRRGINKEM